MVYEKLTQEVSMFSTASSLISSAFIPEAAISVFMSLAVSVSLFPLVLYSAVSSKV